MTIPRLSTFVLNLKENESMNSNQTTTTPKIVRVQFEHLNQNDDLTLGIGVAQPRLSWIVQSDAPGWKQAAYEVEAYTPAGALLEKTGRIESSESVLAPWPFVPLASRQQTALRVRAWNISGQATEWSERYTVEAGLLNPADWSASFIRPGWEEDTSQPQPGPLLRKEFNLEQPVQQARLYVSALGLYEISLNGVVVGDHVMTPGWTSYKHRLRYQVFDVTGLLAQGPNAFGAMLGDGWFRGRLGFGGGARRRSAESHGE